MQNQKGGYFPFEISNKLDTKLDLDIRQIKISPSKNKKLISLSLFNRQERSFCFPAKFTHYHTEEGDMSRGTQDKPD